MNEVLFSVATDSMEREQNSWYLICFKSPPAGNMNEQMPSQRLKVLQDNDKVTTCGKI